MKLSKLDNAGTLSGDVFMNLKQSGADASGDLRVTGPTPAEPTYFEGTVSGSSVILKVPYLSGTLDVSGDEMKGVINGIMPANVSLRYSAFQGPPSVSRRYRASLEVVLKLRDRFNNTTIRRVLYSGLNKRVRRRLHHLVAEWLAANRAEPPARRESQAACQAETAA